MTLDILNLREKKEEFAKVEGFITKTYIGALI